MTEFPSPLIEFQRHFPDEAACAAWLAELRWPDGFRCPACGNDDAWALRTKPWTFECRGYRRQTSVKAGTILHGSKLSLTAWFWAAYLMATHSNGISATQLQVRLDLSSYKSAWLLAAKLRRAMTAPVRNPLAGLVEIDEASIRSRAGENARSGRGRSHEGKLLIAGAVEVVAAGDETAPGRIRLATIEDFSAETLHRFVADDVEPGSLVKTDGWRACNKAEGVLHLPHVVGPQPAHLVMPWIHRVFSLFKTWALGVYHGLRPKHLQTYLDEFVFRFNRRRSRHAAFKTLLGLATNKTPMTYKMLIMPEAKG